MQRIYRVSHAGETLHAVERDGMLYRASGDPFSGLTAHEAIGAPSAVTLVPPVSPTKIVCVGLNYKNHAIETGRDLPAEPLLFIKPPSAVIGPGATIKLPPGVGRVDHEAELGLVIGRRAHRVSRARAWDYILGLICVNDVTARDLQGKESQFTRCKGFDTFAPIGPCVTTGLDGEPRDVEGWVNGTRRQASSTGQLIFPIDYLVEFVTFVMTLEPGDVIATGTPEGIGPIHAGDTVTVKIAGVGELVNTVEAEA